MLSVGDSYLLHNHGHLHSLPKVTARVPQTTSMQSPTYLRPSQFVAFGERRRRPDLARFSLDLSWARGLPEPAVDRAYPSPPMSGSPPLPPRRNPDFDDRGQTSYTPALQDVSRTSQPPPMEARENPLASSFTSYQHEPVAGSSYSYLSTPNEPLSSQYQHLPPPQQFQQQRPLHSPSGLPPGYHHTHSQHENVYGENAREAAAPGADQDSPKTARKTKGHVASACVPCKRAHLRCDAQRPCSRCIGNGKEESCVDVQHKKRGRPRLRDEREPRNEGPSQSFPSHPEHTFRRPMAMYSATEQPIGQQDLLHRSSSYRVLKSQGGHATSSRHPEHSDTIRYGSQQPHIPQITGSQELPCAYLFPDLQIAKATRAFCDHIGTPNVNARRLADIVTDKDKVFHLRRSLEEERMQREPNYLPPIFNKVDEERVVQQIGFGPDDINQFRLERLETLTFQTPDGQHRVFQVRLGLGKRDSIYLVALILVLPPTPTMNTMPPPLYPRESPYGYQPPQQAFAQPPLTTPYQYPTSYSDPRSREAPIIYRQAPPLASSQAGPITPMSSMTQDFPQAPYARPDFSQPQQQIRPGDIQLPQPGRQSQIQLPPIRRQPSHPNLPPSRADDRTGRVDIGGLLEKPESGGR